MANVVTLTGLDTQQVNGRTLVDLAGKECGKLTFPNGIAKTEKGKNGNSIISFVQSGLIADYVVRILAGSDDDKFFNQLLNQWINNPPAFVLLTGLFVKKVGDGAGNTKNVQYVQSSGIISKLPEMMSDQEGNPDQGVSEWHIQFMNNIRVIT